MQCLTTVQAQAAAPPAGQARQIFLSYSHKDKKLVHEFLIQLQVLAQSEPWEIFFDRVELRPGARWEDLIEAALMRCNVFVFFVSPDSLVSPFCIQRELLVALDRVGRGQCVILPVILQPCSWQRLPLPGQNQTLNSIQVLPEDGVPVGTRQGPSARAEVWVKVLDEISRLAAAGARPAAAGSASQQAPALSGRPLRDVPPLLPYLCDQQQPDWTIRELLTQWQDKPVPLVLVLRGSAQDCPDMFAERIIERRLKKLLQNRTPGYTLNAYAGLQWPMDGIADDRLDAFFVEQLAQLVMDDPYADEAQLVAYLNSPGSPKLQHLLFPVGLPYADTRRLLLTTRALAACLGRLAPQLGSRRIACLLWSEDPAFKQAVSEQDWQCQDTGALMGLPAPLMPFDIEAVHQWSMLEEVRKVVRLERQSLTQAFGQQASDLTMHTFVQTIMPVLRDGS